MKDLFMCLLCNFKNHGEITEANMYKGGKFSSIVFETEDAVYTVNVSKEEKKNED